MTTTPLCEYCYRRCTDRDEFEDWLFVLQSYICPDCLSRAKAAFPDDWLYEIGGGRYANGKRDPREVLTQREEDEDAFRKVAFS